MKSDDERAKKRARWHWGAYPTLFPDEFETHWARGDFDFFKSPSVGGAGSTGASPRGQPTGGEAASSIPPWE